MPVVDFTAEADRLRRYGKAALVRTCDELARTTSHRNCALNVAAFSLGRLIGAGCLDRAEVEPVLEGIAYQIGLEPGEIGATIESGITAGQRQPRYPLAG